MLILFAPHSQKIKNKNFVILYVYRVIYVRYQEQSGLILNTVLIRLNIRKGVFVRINHKTI